MPEPPPPVERVLRLAPPAPARAAGRVVETIPGALRLVDGTGSLWVALEGPLPAPGTWLAVEGTWNGERLSDARVESLHTPRAAFPPSEGEWRWLQGGDGARAQALWARAAVLRAIRHFFDGRAFLEVETPAMVPSPGLDLHLDAFEVVGGREPRYLITSPEYQMKRLLTGGLPRIYQLCRCFRRNELGVLHEPEFTMLEWYRAFAGSEEIMQDTEELVAHVAAAMQAGSMTIPGRDAPVDVSPPWERLTVAEAFQRHAGVEVVEVGQDEERFFRLWVDRVEPALGRGRPTFVTRWPAAMASLARLCPDDPAVADRVEAYVDGVELSNGFGELIDSAEQRARLARDQSARAVAGKAVYPVDERFLSALEEGMPPSGGNALGVDRLAMLVLGVHAIDGVLAIPDARL